jgi:hypothetical protein
MHDFFVTWKNNLINSPKRKKKWNRPTILKRNFHKRKKPDLINGTFIFVFFFFNYIYTRQWCCWLRCLHGGSHKSIGVLHAIFILQISKSPKPFYAPRDVATATGYYSSTNNSAANRPNSNGVWLCKFFEEKLTVL